MSKLSLKLLESKSISFLLFLICILLKVFFIYQENFWISFLSDLLLILVVYFTVKKIIVFIRNRNFSQFKLLIFFIIIQIAFVDISAEFSLSVLGPSLKELKGFVGRPTIFTALLSTFYSINYLVLIILKLSILTVLFYTKQKTSIEIYYKIAIINIILSALSSNFDKYFGIEFLQYTFGSVAVFFFIIMTYLNRWVIYLNKKEKYSILILANILLVVTIFSAIRSDSKEQFEVFISIFSNSILVGHNLIFAFSFVYSILLIIVIIFQLPTTEVIEKFNLEVESLQNLSQMISKVLDLTELKTFIVQTIEKLTKTDKVWICLTDENNRCNFFPETRETELIEKILQKKILEEQNFQLTRDDKSLVTFELNSGKEKFNIISIALTYNKNNLGYIFIGYDKYRTYDSEDLKLLKSIGEFTVIAIQNHKLLSESIKKERLERELEVAREIQKKLVPDSSPKFPDLEIESLFVPAFEVGGDYFDFFIQNEKNLSIVIADVSGKGLPASFYMAEIKGIFESLTKILTNPRDIIIQANKILCQSLNRKNFVTVVFASFNSELSEMRIVRSGHCPVIYLNNSNIRMLKPDGIALGLISDSMFENNLEEISIKLQPDDILLFFTDGVTEARNKNLEEFGIHKLCEVMLQNKNESAKIILRKIIEEISLHSKEYQQHDDITMVLLKVKGENND